MSSYKFGWNQELNILKEYSVALVRFFGKNDWTPWQNLSNSNIDIKRIETY